jgi:hypothetical protein
MQFFRRNRFALLTLAILIFSSVMALRQYLANQSVHSQQVEDFLLLKERGEKESTEHLYQMLVQQLPGINDRALVQDLQRTAMVVDIKTPNLDDLVWKYHVSVKNELRRRSEKRLEVLLQGSARQ